MAGDKKMAPLSDIDCSGLGEGEGGWRDAGRVSRPVHRASWTRAVRSLLCSNMLIGLVTDSVLQCFCRSCKAPLGITLVRVFRFIFKWANDGKFIKKITARLNTRFKF